MPGILLDERIRDFVLVPIFLVVVMVSMLRSNLMQCFKSEAKVDLKEVRNSNVLARAAALKTNANFICERAFKLRRAYFIKKDVGLLQKPPPKKDPMQQLSAGPDPMAAMGMMKGQMVFMVSQGGLAYWVSHLFSGFLVAKTPFPLTFRFKSMLQRGVEVSALEPGYVSSLCWYFFVMLSSHTLVHLTMTYLKTSGGEVDDPMAAMMGSIGGASPMGGPDPGKLYKQEEDALSVLNHEFHLDNIEVELWRRWRAERRSA